MPLICSLRFISPISSGLRHRETGCFVLFELNRELRPDPFVPKPRVIHAEAVETLVGDLAEHEPSEYGKDSFAL